MPWFTWPALIGVAIFFAWIAWREFSRWMRDQIQRSLDKAQQDFLTLASQRLATERSEQLGAFDVRNTQVNVAIQGLQDQLKRYEKLVRDFEQDRATKYGSLTQHLTTAVDETRRLQQATSQFTAMLGNSKVRGQWGEKTADDILKWCGLQEGLHYSKQKNAPLGRPDFTFTLPNGHNYYMDVKFPLDNYVKFVNCERTEDKRGCQEQFIKDVRVHMRELEKRDYAPGGGGAPDYVLMFIPNEQVYGTINEWLPGVIDEGLEKHIVLCGPWTLYATVRVMWEAWQHYYHEQAIGEIVKVVKEFQGSFERFKERFGELGRRLGEASSYHAEIARVDYAQLDRKVEQIKKYKEGEGVDLPVAPVKQPVVDRIKELTHD